eukprot:12844573-Alexandrium_andersonii.AAC.1
MLRAQARRARRRRCPAGHPGLDRRRYLRARSAARDGEHPGPGHHGPRVGRGGRLPRRVAN